jgi:hypothetical protein
MYPREIAMSDQDCFRHQLQVTFMCDNDDAYASLERVTGWARRSGVALISLRITRRALHSHAWLRVGADSRDAIELFSNRLGMVIGLEDLMCCSDDTRAEQHKEIRTEVRPAMRTKRAGRTEWTEHTEDGG